MRFPRQDCRYYKEKLHWQHNHHWNPQGHRYAAEALLEYLKQS